MEDKRVITEIDRSKKLMNFTTKPKKKLIEKVETPEEIITEGNIISLSEFVENKKKGN